MLENSMVIGPYYEERIERRWDEDGDYDRLKDEQILAEVEEKERQKNGQHDD